MPPVFKEEEKMNAPRRRGGAEEDAERIRCSRIPVFRISKEIS